VVATPEASVLQYSARFTGSGVDSGHSLSALGLGWILMETASALISRY